MVKPIREQYLDWPRMLLDSYKSGLGMVGKPLLEGSKRLVLGCGMGGSGFSLSAVSPLVGERYPFIVQKSMTPPHYLSSQDIVVAVSYSGETRETIECLEKSLDKGVASAGGVAGRGSSLARLLSGRGLPVVEIEKKGYPRSSLAQLVGGLLALLYAGNVEALVEEAAALLNPSRASEEASLVAESVYNNGEVLIPVVVSCGELGFVAERWATEFSENAKHPALPEVYPEAGHNYIARWHYTRGPYQLVYIDFGVKGLCQIAKKYVLSKYSSVREPVILDYSRLASRNKLAAVLQAAMTAGLATVELAFKLGRNPEVIEAIDEYKRMAKGEG
ncbi:MAG: hypothetical protein F7C33_02775 [Desulfurococcales archaeon]|nr:hypothetical protein [Desulfurococcales archaeon]